MYTTTVMLWCSPASHLTFKPFSPTNLFLGSVVVGRAPQGRASARARRHGFAWQGGVVCVCLTCSLSLCSAGLLLFACLIPLLAHAPAPAGPKRLKTAVFVFNKHKNCLFIFRIRIV